MHEQFQNLLIFRAKFWFYKLYDSGNLLIFDLESSKNAQLEKLQKFPKSLNFQY